MGRQEKSQQDFQKPDIATMPSSTGIEGPLGRVFSALDPLKTGFVKAEDVPKALNGLGKYNLINLRF